MSLRENETGQERATETERSTWTLLEVLRWTTGHFERAGIETARLDAEVLLAHALGCDRMRLYLDFERPLTPEERAGYRELVQRRAKGEPAAYLIGKKEFYGRTFKVDERVLVPRPETEHLVDAALEFLRGRHLVGDGDSGADPDGGSRGNGREEKAPYVLDLCTGSGCIAVTLAAELPNLTVVAVELCPEAAALARENAERLGVSDRVRVLEGDLFEPVRAHGLGPFDLIVSNPPYIASSELAGLMRDVRDHEPRMALHAGPEGTEILERMLREAPGFVSPGGLILLEHGEGQGERLLAATGRDERYERAEDRRDHAGLDRLLVARIVG